MKRLVAGVCLVLATVLLVTSQASAYVSINIDIRPRLAVVPGLPVYYAPALPYNYFSYGGQYYIFVDGVWYVGPTFQGPWTFIALASIPQPILLVPVTYYRAPLPGWHRGGPPPWARHRVEFREREERARRESAQERRHRSEGRQRPEGRVEERREGQGQVPPAVSPQRREHREGRLQEHKRSEQRERQGQVPPAARPEPREHGEGRPQARKGPEHREHERKGPGEPERERGEHHEGRPQGRG